MRMATKLLLGIGLLIAAVAPAAADDPKDIIDRAIRAHAGTEAQLARRKVCISKSRGVMVLPPGPTEMPTQREGKFVLPDRMKWSGEISPPGGKVGFVITLDGMKGWLMQSGAPRDMFPPERDAVQDEAYFLWISSLIPLKEKGYTLSALPTIQVNDRPALGVKVDSQGHSSVQLYFDQRDSLLVKGVYQSREAGLAIPKEIVFSNYRDFDGLKLPTRQVTFINGKKTEEWTFESYRFPAQIDAKEFAKP